MTKGTETKISFLSDYSQGAHPAVLDALIRTNEEHTDGYGTDAHCVHAGEMIREMTGAPESSVHLMIGGTPCNLTFIAASLRPYEAVISARTGHIYAHETGAVEATGHRVITAEAPDGKLTPELIEAAYAEYQDEHTVLPRMVYISQPTEIGTLYSCAEMKAVSEKCKELDLILYVDGARLGSALTCAANDLTLRQLAQLCDAFYIGGAKCGALLGEAVVIPDPGRLPNLFTIIKQHGALLAKGRLLGIQFDELFRDGLYERIGEPAIRAAESIKKALREKGYRLYFDNPTNQIFYVMENEVLKKLEEKVEYSFWEKYDDDHTVIRFATDWGTTEEETRALIDAL